MGFYHEKSPRNYNDGFLLYLIGTCDDNPKNDNDGLIDYIILRI